MSEDPGRNGWKDKIKEIGLDKLVIILLTGAAILLLSVPGFFQSGDEKKENDTIEEISEVSAQKEIDCYVENLENRLEKILKKIEGVGDVDVMISVKGTREQVILKDSNASKDTSTEVDGNGGNRVSSNLDEESKTIYSKGQDGEESPYIIQELEPEISGVLILAEGAGDVSKTNEIIEAVEALFSVPVHKIKVIKMQ